MNQTPLDAVCEKVAQISGKAKSEKQTFPSTLSFLNLAPIHVDVDAKQQFRIESTHKSGFLRFQLTIAVLAWHCGVIYLGISKFVR